MPFKSLIPFTSKLSVGHPFSALRDEIDRVFEEVGRGLPTPSLGQIAPRVDVSETEAAIVVTAELPGLEEKDVEIDFTDDVLTIKGEKKSEKEEKDEKRHVSERTYGSFYRAIRLPTGVDPAAIEAKISNGVLTVTAPKPAPRVTKKIEIKKAG